MKKAIFMIVLASIFLVSCSTKYMKQQGQRWIEIGKDCERSHPSMKSQDCPVKK